MPSPTRDGAGDALPAVPESPLPPPPSYAEIASPLNPQHAFQSVDVGHPAAGAAAADTLPVHPAFDHAFGSALNLPRGYFLVRNAAQGKALDLLGHKPHEGAEIGLHPIKRPQLRGLSLQHKGNNQLFFLSWDGHLVSASASREIDVEDNRLVLTFPHAITKYPSTLSHPPSRFRLDPSTSTLHVVYSHDPSFTGPDGTDDWQDDDYIVEAVPIKRKPVEPTLWGNAPNQLLSGLGKGAATLGGRIGGFLGGRFSQPASPNPAALHDADAAEADAKEIDEPELPPPPTPDKEKDVPPVPSTSTDTLPNPASPAESADEPAEANESDSDTEPSAFRPVRIVRLPPGWREKFPSAALRTAPNTSFGVTRWPASAKELRKWRRRQWDVVPVTVQPLPVDSAERSDDFLIPSPGGSESIPRTRSEASYYDGEREGEDDAREYDDGDDGAFDPRDFDRAFTAPGAYSDEPELPLPPVDSTPFDRRASVPHAFNFANPRPPVGGSPGAVSDSRPLPPSPPLPSVPLTPPKRASTATAAAQDAEDMQRTPRPDAGERKRSRSGSRSGSGSGAGEGDDSGAPSTTDWADASLVGSSVLEGMAGGSTPADSQEDAAASEAGAELVVAGVEGERVQVDAADDARNAGETEATAETNAVEELEEAGNNVFESAEPTALGEAAK